MYTDILTQLGLAKNESKIYETLLHNGESSIGDISTKANINRRNVYDSIDRLVEKGLIFETRLPRENLYQAVDPKKLMEILKEKENALNSILPDMLKTYGSTPHEEDVYIYRGVEGWKNYMRDIIRVGKDLYTLGGKGAWSDPRLARSLEEFKKEVQKKNISIKTLYDHEVQSQNRNIVDKIDTNFRFLPAKFSTPASLDIFGDHVVITSKISDGKIDENSSLTVIVNKDIAEAFKTWFELIWEASK